MFAAPKIDIKLHAKQAEVFRHPARYRTLVAGRRFGKTTLARAEIIRAARGKGRRIIWYVAPTFTMARDLMWDELIANLPRSWIKKTHDTRLEIRLINGVLIQLKGSDRPDTLRGRALDFLICDEYQDFRVGTWQAVLYPTLTTTKGRALIIGTPKAYNHFYEMYRLGQMKKHQKSGQYMSWQVPTIMSPFFPPSEIAHARASMDEKTFRQEFEASFESMSGRVYYAFDRNIHVGNYPFNPKLPIIVGQDFNVDPMSTVIMQIQPDGEIWIVDEIHFPNSNVPEVAEELDKRYFKWKRSITLYPDPAGGNRNSSRGESDLDVFRSAGFNKLDYPKKHPLVSDRVRAVNSMFRSVDGTIRLRVNKTCLHVIEGAEQTIYKPGTPNVDKSMGVEHMMDAVGYPIHRIFGRRIKELMGISI